MRIVVIGGGVAGITSAYYLARDGHEVTVLEKAGDLGTDATGGNAGLIAPNHSFAWASPQAPKMLVKSLRGEATAIRVKPSVNPTFLGWGVQFLRECTPARAKSNTVVKLELAKYSQDEMYRLADEERLEYQVVKNGCVYLYRDERDLQIGLGKMELVESHGREIRRLSPADLVDLDPAFARTAEVVTGAIYGVEDGSGNSEMFTRELARASAQKYGVQVVHGISVERFSTRGRTVEAVVTNRGRIEADAFVLAAGIYSAHLARTAGQRIPVFPAKGYSLTVPIDDPALAPTVGGVDEKTLVAWSRMGEAMRISSTAQFDGYNRDYSREDFSNILSTAKQLFPGAADWDSAAMRSCMRPMTPDGPPIIGRGKKHDNLYYNTGHGHMGWTMACGSSLFLADVVAGRTPRLDPAPFSVRAMKGLL